ncbi:hypothetical protein MMC27_008186 [Xylographa pallens]|nr:hypothetical protein [Xylographa pallens]
MTESDEIDNIATEDLPVHENTTFEEDDRAHKCLIEEINTHADLVLLDDTNVNSCLFQYGPSDCWGVHAGPTLSHPDLEKINEVNLRIKRSFTNGEHLYLHGMSLKTSEHERHPDNHPVYILGAVLSSPQTTTTAITAFLERVTACGRNIILEKGYRIPRLVVRLYELDGRYVTKQHKPNFQELPVFRKLSREISKFFSSVQHVALVYGSNNSGANMLLSNVDVMAFAKDDFYTRDKVAEFKQLYVNIIAEEGLAFNDDIPLLQKLLIPLSVAQAAAATKSQIKDSKVVSIKHYSLRDKQRLDRLIFNVLTIPTIVLSGDSEVLHSARADAEAGLLKIVSTITGQKLSTSKDFVSAALPDGTCTGKDYLGYKDRPDVRVYLEKIFDKQMALVTPKPSPARPFPPTVIGLVLPVGVVQVGKGKYHSTPKQLTAIDNALLAESLAQGLGEGQGTARQNAPTEQTPRRVPNSSLNAASNKASLSSSTATHHTSPPPVTGKLAMQAAPRYFSSVARTATIDQNPESPSNISSTPPISAAPMPAAPCVIFINGPPGICRVKIARRLKPMLSKARILEDSKLISIAEALEPAPSTTHHALRRHLRKGAIDHLKSSECEGTTVIIPYHTPLSAPDTLEVFLEYLDLARSRQIPFVALQVLCSEEARLAHLRRTAERRNMWPSTFTDDKVLLQLRRQERRMGQACWRVELGGGDIFNCQLDITGLDAEQAAGMIVRLLPRAAACTPGTGVAAESGNRVGTTRIIGASASARRNTVVAGVADKESSAAGGSPEKGGNGI